MRGRFSTPSKGPTIRPARASFAGMIHRWRSNGRWLRRRCPSEIERMSDPVSEFNERNRAMIAALAADAELREVARRWLVRATELEYSYHFRWMDRPIIQLPQDMIALQEIIWRTQPEVVIETGVAHGGSIVFYASLLELLGGDREVIGIDVDIRAHNRAVLNAHRM